MLAYAADRPTIAQRRSSPHSFLFIATAHVIAIAAVVSIKMDLPSRIKSPPTVVDTIRLPPVPQSEVQPPKEGARQTPRASTVPADVAVPLPTPGPTIVPDPGPTIFDPPGYVVQPRPVPAGETRGATLATPPSALKPPYPGDKLALEQEASLTLKLSIDERGRVTAVEPVGRADRSFLEAARRHLIAHWRYRPAMKDGQAIATTLVTTLHFRLDG
jgi:protein TonB